MPLPTPGSTALSHLRICDLTGQLAGAGATKFLAAFGAQVIRVEDPVRQGTWDILRGVPPYVDDRRGIYTELTAAGQALYEQAHPIHDETLERALGEAVTQPELAPVVHALQAVTVDA